MDEFNDNNFEDEEERKQFERFYQNFKRSKETFKIINEYYSWLKNELDVNSYAVVPEKYTMIKNFPLCIIKLPSMPDMLLIRILN